MSICKQFFVSGRVQGVWYRASAQQQAQALNIGGYARNLPDGSVEVLACGAEDKLAELESWLWQGPTSAQVADVQAEEVEYRETDTFETR
ncbi:acylphosphatase [Candidatus Tenderia electrophaga]|uniref:acylphosphatase n=1 Tax=Candidatus Tenderia electrophaga TaxID=1748243 RepID=A0A0S2TBM3_9GAMM|nr:acylphosphatase [Candidatus Tenderia electrophaga]